VLQICRKRPVDTDQVSCSFCRSVGRSVCPFVRTPLVTAVNCGKTVHWIETPFEVMGWVGPRSDFLDEVQTGRENFRGSSIHRAHQLYKNISMLFLLPVKDGKLSTGVNTTFMHHVTVNLQQSKITLQNNCVNNTSITQPTLSFYL